MSRSDLVPYAALLLRVALGVLFLAHAWMKYAVFTPAGTATYFESLGLPGFVGYLTMAAETLGGICLILGVATSLVVRRDETVQVPGVGGREPRIIARQRPSLFPKW